MAEHVVDTGRNVLAGYLARADITFTPQMRVIVSAIALGPGVLGLLAGVSPVGLVIAFTTPSMVFAWLVRTRVAQRPDRVCAQLPDVLRVMAGALGAGASLRQAISRATHDQPEPIASEVRVLADDLDGGDRLDDALESFLRRVPRPEVEMLVCALSIAVRTGADLGRLIGDFADGIEERRAHLAALAALSQQARMTAWMVAALPLAGAMIVEVTAPGVITRAFTSGVGKWLGLTAIVLFTIAILAVRRLGRVAA